MHLSLSKYIRYSRHAWIDQILLIALLISLQLSLNLCVSHLILNASLGIKQNRNLISPKIMHYIPKTNQIKSNPIDQSIILSITRVALKETKCLSVKKNNRKSLCDFTIFTHALHAKSRATHALESRARFRTRRSGAALGDWLSSPALLPLCASHGQVMPYAAGGSLIT